MSVLTEDKLTQARAIYNEYLSDRGLRQTSERKAIFEEVYATDTHFDADELYIQLKEKGVGVSRATVYNTLDLLTDCELVVRHQFGKNQATFERAYSYWQHDHLICTDCGHIHEFCDPRIQSVRDMVEEIFNFEVTKHSMQMYGVCRDDQCPNRN